MRIEQGYVSIIRWCPDILREEYRNIGVVLVDQAGETGGIKHVSKSMLPEGIGPAGIVLELLSSLHRRFQFGEGPSLEELKVMSTNLCSYLQVTDPKPVSVLGGDWNTTLSDLWNVYAKPPPRPNASITANLSRHLQHFISARKIAPDYEFTNTSSGIAWKMDFFVLDGEHVGLDALNLSLRRPDHILDRAAGEAYKVRDIVQANSVHPVICCEVSQQPDVARATKEGIGLIQKEGAEVVTDLPSALHRLNAAVQG